MLGHDHVTVHHEAIFTPRLLEDSQEKVPPFACPQLWASTVAAAGNKVQILCAVETMQSLGHLASLRFPSTGPL